MGLCSHPLGYRGVNFGFTTKAQWVARNVAMARHQANGHVLACLHSPNSQLNKHEVGGNGRGS